MSEPENPHRRQMLTATGAALVTFGAARPAVASENDPIRQPDTVDDAAFIARAFEMRQLAVDKGDQPYGAVVVMDGKIIGQSWSRVVLDEDPTGHAEMAAIRDAARRLGNRKLSGAVMYSSSHPCPMCEAACYWAGISKMVYGRNAADGGAPKLCG